MSWPVIEISKISTDISPIFHVSVNIDTIFPSDSRSKEISAFFTIIGDISPIYRFFTDFSLYFSKYRSLFISRPLFTTVHKMEKFVAKGVRTLPKSAGFQPPIH